MTAEPIVTVIIPVYNAARHLQETVESVLAQSYADYELLVIDDGSSDNSLKILNDFAVKHPERIHVFRHPGGANKGVSATRNLGLSHALGKYTAFLDSDDVWYPEKLARQVALMDRYPEMGVTFTLSEILRDKQNYEFLEGVETVGAREPPDDCKEAMYQVITMYLNYIFSSVMVKTTALREVGGFIEYLPYQSEDRIMVAKVAANHQIGRVDEVLCAYRAHDGSYSASLVRKGYAEAVFFDMQTRIAEWLQKEAGKPAWAREVALEILPPMFIRAVRCTFRPRILMNVLANYFKISYVCGLSPVTIFRRAFHKTWVGDWVARVKQRLGLA